MLGGRSVRATSAPWAPARPLAQETPASWDPPSAGLPTPPAPAAVPSRLLATLPGRPVFAVSVAAASRSAAHSAPPAVAPTATRPTAASPRPAAGGRAAVLAPIWSAWWREDRPA